MQDGNWRLAIASAIGTSHIASGLPCQDHARHWLTEGGETGALVTVVCDGAGSAAHSQAGAQIATDTFIDLARSHFQAKRGVAEVTLEVAREWITQIAAALGRRAATENHVVRDYACTLLAVIAGEEETVFVQVGDGAIVVSHGEEDGWSYVFWPQHGEFANTTNFVVSSDVLDILDYEIAPRRISEFAVFTDGIENLVLNQSMKVVHGPFFEKIMRPVRKSKVHGLDDELSSALSSYLASPIICERTDDDKTLVLATRIADISGVTGK